MRWLIVLTLVSLAGCADPPLCEPGECEDENTDTAPPMSFNKNGDSLKIISADAEADWGALAGHVTGDCEATLVAGGTEYPAGSPMAPEGTFVLAGDRIDIAGAGTCEFTLSHVPTNQHYDTWTFSF